MSDNILEQLKELIEGIYFSLNEGKLEETDRERNDSSTTLKRLGQTLIESLSNLLGEGDTPKSSTIPKKKHPKGANPVHTAKVTAARNEKAAELGKSPADREFDHRYFNQHGSMGPSNDPNSEGKRGAGDPKGLIYDLRKGRRRLNKKIDHWLKGGREGSSPKPYDS